MNRYDLVEFGVSKTGHTCDPSLLIHVSNVLVVTWYDVQIHFADPSGSSATTWRETCFVVWDEVRSSRAGCFAAAAMSSLSCNIKKTFASLFVNYQVTRCMPFSNVAVRLWR